MNDSTNINNVWVELASVKALKPDSENAFIGLRLDSGVEMLIHVGIDTVNLAGKGFTVKVAAGDRVEAGTPLVTFDRKVIEDAGYSLVTPVLVTNPKKFGSVDQAASGQVEVGSPLIKVTAR